MASAMVLGDDDSTEGGRMPYNVGQMRAKLALRAALATDDESVKHRRLKHILESNRLNNDVRCYEWRMADQHFKDLSRRLLGPDENDPRFADLGSDEEKEDQASTKAAPRTSVTAATAAAAPEASAPQSQQPAKSEEEIRVEASSPPPPSEEPAGTEGTIDDTVDFALIPGLGAEDFPGFPANECPATIPDLTGHSSLLATLLQERPELYTNLQESHTGLGVSLARCIKAGIDIEGHPMVKTAGLFAGDAESFELFAPIFDPVIAQMHRSFKSEDGHPCSKTGDISEVVIDPSMSCVEGVRVRFRRNLKSYPTPVALDPEQRKMVETIVSDSLQKLVPGTYTPLSEMTAEIIERNRSHGIIFEAPESNLMRSAGFGRHWPSNRGIFTSNSEDLFALINNEEHLEITVLRKDADLKAAYSQLSDVVGRLEGALMLSQQSFAENDRYGFLSTSMEHLGSAMQAAVILRLPLLGEQEEFRALAKRLRLHASREPEMGDQAWRVGNAEKLGTAVIEQLNTVIEGARRLVDIEAQLMAGEDVDLSQADSAPATDSTPQA